MTALRRRGDGRRQVGGWPRGDAQDGSFFALWYLFNIGYNIYNKKALNVLPCPGLLLPYSSSRASTSCSVHGRRKTPKLSQDNLKTLFPVACGHLGGAVIS